MAGAGVRVFQAGEVLTATLVNTYLQDQVVARFASIAVRDAAFGLAGNLEQKPTLEEGRVCYLDSTNELQFFSGSAWVSLSAEAVIGQILAKGDLVVGTGVNTISRVAIGVNDTTLVADSTTPSGVAWKAITIPAGTIPSSALNWTYYNTEGDLPAAGSNHGMFAHVHATGAAYYAHAGSWFELARADATIRIETANYPLVLTDKNKFIKMQSASIRTITVPSATTANFPEGSQIHLIRYGSGTLEIVPETGSVIIHATPGKFLRAQYSSATLLKCADTNVWMLMGDLSAS